MLSAIKLINKEEKHEKYFYIKQNIIFPKK